jgi:tRNA(adenine34) deaminase
MFGMLTPADDHFWMQKALAEALKANEKKEVPVGAVAVFENRVIGRGHNQVESLKDATAHAEMLALTSASQTLESWRLSGVMLYTTLEPCTMCAGAAILSRIDRLVYGAKDPKAGACGSVVNIMGNAKFNHRVKVEYQPLPESEELLKQFFKRLRVESDAAGKKI